MSERKYHKLYEEIMRGAEERRRVLAHRELERQHMALKKYGAKLTAVQLRKEDEIRCVIEQIDHEIARLSARRDRTSSIEKRIEYKAAIVHLRETRERISGQNKRKPPESGIAVPAVPPKGPLPKQGGAAAPLDFDRA
jgi:hypothetical protein